MPYLQSFIAVVFSRAALAAALLLLVGLLTWFFGPMVGVGVDGLRPLASVETRLVVIGLLLALAVFWLVDGPMVILAIVACGLLVWHAGPLLSYGGTQPLASVAVRVFCLGVLLFVALVYGFCMLLRAISKDPEFLSRFFSFNRSEQGAGDLRDALRPLVAKADAAIAQLRLLQAGGFWRRSFEKNRHLYALPWFLVIGAPGSGKTAMLRQSGLQFPLALRHLAGSAASGFPGSHATPAASAAPTDNWDWWLGNEAVLIDTAGRYCGFVPGGSSADVAVTVDKEWRGLLGLLRAYRPRAPVNGVVLTLSVADLLERDEAIRSRHAAVLRDRLADIRSDLGIRCPVYLLITKTDQLRGFRAYFQSLTSEGRTQVWGFTLALGGGAFGARTGGSGAADVVARREALRQELSHELALLVDRVGAGQRVRFEEEFEADRRRALFALPLELSALADPLLRTIDEVFLDSRFDDTQARHALRGVYFSSAEQSGQSGQGGVHTGVQADADTVLQQLLQLRGTPGRVAQAGAPTGVDAQPDRQGYFLHELLTQVVVPEAGLVRPNLRWELRFRLLRLLGHGLALMIFVWLCAALTASWRNNLLYLAAVQARTAELHGQVAALLAEPAQANAPAILDATRRLPQRSGGTDTLSPANAASRVLQASQASFHYGLDTEPPVLAASVEVYARLQQITLLPAVLQRMEAVLAKSVRDGDAPLVYATLRAYRLLHDPVRYGAEGGAADVWAWVSADRGGPMGDTATHLQSLFSGARPVQAASPANEALVRQAQRFLDADTSSQRIYQRAKAALTPDAPPDFTLVRAVGQQVGTVFAREGGLPLETGVAGLFTRDGYRKLFDPRLAAFVARADDDDAWVMGRPGANSTGAGASASPAAAADAVVVEVRRQYLEEYARRWSEFLDSIRAVGSGALPQAGAGAGAAATGSQLGFELSVLRQLAAPDSPLTRLARAVVAETTLSTLSTLSATAQTAQAAPDASLTAALRPDADKARQQERELVDKRFAALRELVTGQADLSRESARAATAPSTRPGLESVMAAVNDFYTQLVVADTALGAGGLPPGGVEAGARLALEASTLPAPLREVLTSLAHSGSETVSLGAGGILRRQAQLQFDRLVGLMAQNVGEPCRRGIDGHYPFTAPAAAAQDAAIEDVTHMFAVGGAADEYFRRYLSPFVDTSVRPWRYRAVAMASTDTEPATPAGPGPTLVGELLKLLAHAGPDLDAFYRAQQIRELFFDEAGGKKLHWKLDLSVLELDPTITDLLIDIDGQGQRYMHGPVQALHVEWPGPRGGSMAALTANPRISGATSTVSVTGAWALLHLLDKGRIVNSATAGRVSVELSFDGRKALLGIASGSQPNPLNSDLLRGFHCPATTGTAA